MSSQLALLATYRERRFNGSRTFELSADSIRVHGSVTFESSFDVTVPLARIDPRVSRFHIRHKFFWIGVLATIGGFFGTALLVSSVNDPSELALVGLTGSALSGVAICLATIRKVGFARFGNDAGIVALDIARAGPDEFQFDDFLGKLVETIKAARGTGNAT